MNSFLNPNNGTSLIGIIDITAHSISLIGANDYKPINELVIPKSGTSAAERYDVIIDETGNICLLCTSFLEILMTQKSLV